MEVAVPMTLAQLLNLLYNIVDRMYIGRIPEVGRVALTGVGICFPGHYVDHGFYLSVRQWRKPSLCHGDGAGQP